MVGDTMRLTRENIHDHIRVDERGCWIWQHCKSLGYGVLYDGHRMARAHRVTYELFVGRIPKGALVCHHCDVKSCVNPKHLYAGDKRSNMLDALARGQKRPSPMLGERNPAAVLTLAQVREIRAAGRGRAKEMADRFGVRLGMVQRILRGETWREPGVVYESAPRSSTHCRNGHQRTSENTYQHPKTGRLQCRECARVWWAANRSSGAV